MAALHHHHRHVFAVENIKFLINNILHDLFLLAQVTTKYSYS